MTVERTGSACA